MLELTTVPKFFELDANELSLVNTAIVNRLGLLKNRVVPGCYIGDTEIVLNRAERERLFEEIHALESIQYRVLVQLRHPQTEEDK